MAHNVSLSDEQYQTMVALAAERGQTPEELLATLVDEAWERLCAAYDVAFHNDPEWQASAREAAARGNEPQSTIFASTAELFAALAGKDAPRPVRHNERPEDAS